MLDLPTSRLVVRRVGPDSLVDGRQSFRNESLRYGARTSSCWLVVWLGDFLMVAEDRVNIGSIYRFVW